jgi:hypothetical protein
MVGFITAVKYKIVPSLPFPGVTWFVFCHDVTVFFFASHISDSSLSRSYSWLVRWEYSHDTPTIRQTHKTLKPSESQVCLCAGPVVSVGDLASYARFFYQHGWMAGCSHVDWATNHTAVFWLVHWINASLPAWGTEAAVLVPSQRTW